MGKVVTLILAVVLVDFNDKLENVHREKGDFFKCTPKRYDEILSYNSSLIKAVPDEKDIADPVGYTSDSDDSNVGAQNQESSVEDDQNSEKSVCDIAQLSDEELLKLAKQKKVRSASKMSREQLIEALQ